ncbi:flagellar hook-length control protein FliK [Aliishimia ponticola]|uniref:flagellar hook-length control protein FliK n=1 Tax=Aliishimia ponticola TaxID=2499833 RepID=UPI001455EC36|nr:flagellar hook-length control protein FliK [Aliishimia ponticola]
MTVPFLATVLTDTAKPGAASSEVTGKPNVQSDIAGEDMTDFASLLQDQVEMSDGEMPQTAEETLQEDAAVDGDTADDTTLHGDAGLEAAMTEPSRRKVTIPDLPKPKADQMSATMETGSVTASDDAQPGAVDADFSQLSETPDAVPSGITTGHAQPTGDARLNSATVDEVKAASIPETVKPQSPGNTVNSATKTGTIAAPNTLEIPDNDAPALARSVDAEVAEPGKTLRTETAPPVTVKAAGEGQVVLPAEHRMTAKQVQAMQIPRAEAAAQALPDAQTTPSADSPKAATNIANAPQMTPAAYAQPSPMVLQNREMRVQAQAAEKLLDLDGDLETLRFDSPTSSASQTSVSSASSALQRAELPRAVALQIQNAARNMTDKTIEIALNPQELGKVRLSIATGETGVTLTVLAERPETIELMRRNADTLAQELADLGFEHIDLAFGQGDSAESHMDNNPDGQDSGAALDWSDDDMLNPAPAEAAPAARPIISADGRVDIRV